MKALYIISILSFLFLCNLKGQDHSTLRFHVQGYNLVFPGIEIAFQQPILKSTLNVEKQNKFIINAAQVLDFYVQKRNHSGIGFMEELNLQFQDSQGFIFETYGGFGMLISILSGDVYELNDNGKFESNKLKGNVYTTWKAGLAIAKVHQLSSGRITSYQLRTGIRYAKTPGALIVPNISFGVNYSLNKTKKLK